MKLHDLTHTVLLVVMLLMISVVSPAQFTPRAIYNFDGMDLSESNGNYASGVAMNTDFYDCGVGPSSFALFMDGNLDTIRLDANVKEIFREDFSLSFYFRVDRSGLAPGDNIGHTLFSIQNNCERDSSLNIRYLGIAGTNTTDDLAQITLEYSGAQILRFNYELNQDLCWHQVVFVKNGTTFSLYVDGEFIESILFVADITLGRDFPVYVGFSDCVGRIDEPFNGRIDEIRIYNEAITEEYIESTRRFPDQIISQDTTLFEGDSYEIITGTSCAPSITWAPTSGLDDPLSINPTATPTSSTTYQIEFDHGDCISTDTVRISIVKDDDIDCDNILLPKAFTPNGDNLNDAYGISNKFIVTDLLRFEIYDRWGMKLFESNSKDVLWNGQYQGQPMMPGTYVYKIEYSCLDNIYQKTASFSLIK